jgi:hypothetical protein
MKERRWKTQRELAEMIIAKAKNGQQVTLTADTAYFVGLRLKRESKLPTRDAIALLLCGASCASSCYACTGKANKIVELYGCNIDEPSRPPGSDRA